MAKIATLLRQFLKEFEWACECPGERALASTAVGNNGRWPWMARWTDDESVLVCYNALPAVVPQERRRAVAELLTRLNYGLMAGCWEMDFSDGECRCRTSFVFRGAEPSSDAIEATIITGLMLMDEHLWLLLGVAGGTEPEAASARHQAEEQAEADDGETKEDASEADLAEARSRRVEQLAAFLRLMDKRAHEEAKGACFCVLSVPDGPRAGDDGETLDPMVQFCFERKWFAVDIPNTSISRSDARRVLAERRGFYREKDESRIKVSDEGDAEQYDPIGRKYIYGDEREAAEDAAYVFFDVWGLPPDTPVLAQASAFEGELEWEKPEPLEAVDLHDSHDVPAAKDVSAVTVPRQPGAHGG